MTRITSPSLHRGGKGPLLHLGHELLQGHGLAHVALDLQLPRHEGGGRLQLPREHLAKVCRAQREPEQYRTVRTKVGNMQLF